MSLKPTQVFSPLAEQLEPEGAFVYLDLADEVRRRGVDVISFGIGQPDFSPPKEVIEAIKEALDKGYTKYISPLGLRELREAIARYVNEKYGIDVKPSEVAVTVGAKAALFMTIALLTRPGDEVVVQDPSFPVYESVIRFAGGRPVFVRLREENEFRLRIEDVEDVIKGLHRVRGLIINTPHNPTGSILGKEDIEEIIRFAKRRNMFIVSDEIYEDFVYEGKHYSFLQDPDWRDYIVYISGFSKTWSMTGLRIGYVIAREEIIKKLEVFATNVYSCPPAPFQLAAIKALELGTKWFERYLDEYRRRRDAAYEELSKVPGVRVIKGRGAFYLFPNVKGVARAVGARDVDELAKRVLFEAGIVFLPGTAFPLRGGEGYFRVSYALPVERIREGIKRFRDWVKDKVGL